LKSRSPLIDTVSDYLSRFELVSKPIAVACSGGVDSFSLLDILRQFVPSENLVCIHLNHGWLESAIQAQELLKNYCQKNNLKFICKQFALGEMVASENTARQARYDFFREACSLENISDLFMGHNLNDQAETVLFRLFRGTNTFGLSGILEQKQLSLSESHTLTLHRPFLGTARQEISSYASENLNIFYEDPSNEDTKYHRNLIRHNILPTALNINPQAEKNIVKLSELIREEQDYFTDQVSSALASLGDLPWSLEKFRLLPRTIKRKILEKTFCTQIKFTDEFLMAVDLGGFHRINFEKNKFFTIKQKQIHLEIKN
jgi:tRNA(Ile)-lysidine synthetase-like protein